MLLAIDVGNSNIVLGGYKNGELCFLARIATDRRMEADQYALQIQGILELYGVKGEQIEKAVMASVVSPLTPVLQKALLHFTDTPVRVLCIDDAQLCGIEVVIDNPQELGTDILASAIAVRDTMPLPAVIIDMGTATKLTALNEDGKVLGVAILPGLFVSLDALVSRANALGGISLEKPKHAIGRNTPESMRSGVVLGSAAMLDGMIDRFSDEMGTVKSVVATGGGAALVVPCCRNNIKLSETLLLDGLVTLIEKDDK